MTKERWVEIIGNIKDNFEVNDEGKMHLDDEGGVDVEYIEFRGPLGLMRLELVVKPVVVGKKTTYSRRIGSETAVEYMYSENDLSCKLDAYKWDDNQSDWIEIESAAFT